MQSGPVACQATRSRTAAQHEPSATRPACGTTFTRCTCVLHQHGTLNYSGRSTRSGVPGRIPRVLSGSAAHHDTQRTAPRMPAATPSGAEHQGTQRTRQAQSGPVACNATWPRTAAQHAPVRAASHQTPRPQATTRAAVQIPQNTINGGKRGPQARTGDQTGTHLVEQGSKAPGHATERSPRDTTFKPHPESENTHRCGRLYRPKARPYTRGKAPNATALHQARGFKAEQLVRSGETKRMDELQASPFFLERVHRVTGTKANISAGNVRNPKQIKSSDSG